MQTQTPPEVFVVRVWPQHEGGSRIEAYHLVSERYMVAHTLEQAARWMDDIAAEYGAVGALATRPDDVFDQALTPRHA